VSKHDILQDLKRVALELNKTPTAFEYQNLGKFSDRQIRTHFGGYSAAFIAAGLQGIQEAKQSKWKYVPTKIDPNLLKNVIRLNLKDLFKRAGDPESLKMLCMPDTHLKYADRAALNCFYDYLQFYKPDIFMIMGDFLDAAGLSHWDSDSFEPKRIVPECLLARKELAHIQSLAPNTSTWIYLEGNHEDWINQFLVYGANPQLFDGLEQLGLEINLRKLLNLDEMGFQLFKVNQIIRIGLAGFSHGLYTGDTHAKKHLGKVKSTIFYGHCHDGQSYEDTSIEGMVEAQSFRCLCDLNPKYLKNRLNNWSNGFGQLEFFRDGSYSKVLHSINQGRMSFNGRIFK
jgi:hypothetical protein